jgi:mono/diheme cytochrome c family protein
MTEMLRTKQEGRMLLSLKLNSGARQEHRSSAGAVILMIATITLTCSTAAFAQNEDKVKAGVTAWRNSGCADCHGAFANGEKERDESPTGADLRRARLNAEELKLAIRCGRPGTGMPAFEEGASGCPGGGGDLYPAPSKLSPEEIDNVVAYLQARIVGKGKITKQECLLYYTDKPDWCDDYN